MRHTCDLAGCAFVMPPNTDFDRIGGGWWRWPHSGWVNVPVNQRNAPKHRQISLFSMGQRRSGGRIVCDCRIASHQNRDTASQPAPCAGHSPSVQVRCVIAAKRCTASQCVTLCGCVMAAEPPKKKTQRLAGGHIFFFFVGGSLTAYATRKNFGKFFC